MLIPSRNPNWWSKGRFQGIESPEIIRTQCRSSVVLPDFIGCKFGVHNGKDYVQIEVTESMVGHKLGEFSHSRKQPVHKKVESSGMTKKINPKTGKAG
jgi:small subunit ribosomal protein S19